MPPKRNAQSRTWPRDLRPDTQIDFYYRLEEIRGRFLGAALGEVVRRVDIPTLDVELKRSAPRSGVAYLAGFGLRGETFFPTPSLLRARPSLLGYYRLLYGISQKDFYRTSAFGGCKRMEEADQVPPVAASDLPGLCRSLSEIGKKLLDGVPTISIGTIHELQLLTLGPQFRGSRNTEIGQSATRRASICSRRFAQPTSLRGQIRRLS